LAITVSMTSRLCVDWRREIASDGELSDDESRGMTISLLPGPVGMVDRDWEVGAEGSRTPAMTVVLGRRTMAERRPRPSPCVFSFGGRLRAGERCTYHDWHQ